MGTDDSARVTRTAIFGGCVSRDTLAFAGDEHYPLSRYIARHSLLSAGTDASRNFPKFEVTSKFQQKLIEFDVKGALAKNIAAFKEVDVFLWDLNVERSGCWEFEDGTVVTNSPDLRRVPEIKEALSTARKIDFGSDEHRFRWQGAASLFVDALRAFGLKDRTLVLAPEWALTDTEGAPTQKGDSLDPRDASQAFAPYVDHLDTLGVTIARFEGLVADLSHRWGRAPFHYTPEAYEMFRGRIDEFVRERHV